MKKHSPHPYLAGVALVLFLVYAVSDLNNSTSQDEPMPPPSIEEIERLETSARAERKALELHDQTAGQQIEIEKLRMIGQGVSPAVAESDAKVIVESRRSSILSELEYLERAVDSAP